jgi:polyisoprenoid-binding protein YceI
VLVSLGEFGALGYFFVISRDYYATIKEMVCKLHVQTSNFNQQKKRHMATNKWVLEPTHSELQFKVRHMMISNVSGNFNKFDATVETDGDDLTTAKISFTADVDSLTTNNEQRDGHIKSADFFDAAAYPHLSFVAHGLKKHDDANYEVTGDLTIHGVTKPASFTVEHGGVINDPWGNTRTGFTLDGKINRKEFGLNWEALTETGGLVVGNDVKIHANVEFVKAN